MRYAVIGSALRRGRIAGLAAGLALIATACSSATDPETTPPPTPALSAAETTTAAPSTTSSAPATTAAPSAGQLRNSLGYVFPDPPSITEAGDLTPDVIADLDALWATLTTRDIDTDAIERLGTSGDVRVAWLLVDLLRFIQVGAVHEALLEATYRLTGIEPGADPVAGLNPWQSFTDHLIAWDLPAHPEYVDYKGELFLIVEPEWQPFFEDPDSAVDWRLTSWGGVRIDSRPLGDQLPCPRGCIPALDDPSVTDAAGGSWYPDDRIVFGVVVNGEARAYPKHQMEVHEMVNDTLGGRRLGIPYCTLCGSAQAYFTDSVPESAEVPVLRTSGLLTRSNKVMFDLNTFSIFDTFTGEALSGPLRAVGTTLEQTTLVTSTWGEWKAAHPETTIVAEDGGINRPYGLDPLGGRDDDGPIFPIGDVDHRLPVQAAVIGVIMPDGTPIAFPVEDLRATDDDSVVFNELVITPDGGGFVASLEDGTAVVAHQAFWFAWSQFHPDTLVWSPTGPGT